VHITYIIMNPCSMVRMQTHAGGTHVPRFLLLLRDSGDDVGDSGSDDQCGQCQSRLWSAYINDNIAFLWSHILKGHPFYLKEFSWDDSVKHLILSSFFWGYICTQIPGSIIAQIWSAQGLFSIALIISGLMTLGSPIAAHYGNWQAMIVTRIISGLAQGTVLPCLHTLLSKWVPPEERGRLCEWLHFYSNVRELKKFWFFSIFLFFNLWFLSIRVMLITTDSSLGTHAHGR